VPDDDAEALDDAAIEPVGKAHLRIGLRDSRDLGDRRIRRRHERQPGFERGDQSTVGVGQRDHRRAGGATRRMRRAFGDGAGQVETEVDPVVRNERQRDGRVAGFAPDRRQRRSEP
jgi:hypothetical protein